MVIGYPTFNIFNHQNSTNPEVYCSSTPFWKSIIPFPNNPWNESVFKLHGFWISFAEFHAFSIFSACIGCTSTKGIVFCWIPGVQNEGLGGYREMVIPTSPNTLGPGWLKDDEQILPNDTSSFPEVSDRKTTIQKKVLSLHRRQKHHHQFIFSNLVGRIIWLLGIGWSAEVAYRAVLAWESRTVSQIIVFSNCSSLDLSKRFKCHPTTNTTFGFSTVFILKHCRFQTQKTLPNKHIPVKSCFPKFFLRITPSPFDFPSYSKNDHQRPKKGLPHNVAIGIPNEYTVPTTPWIPSPTPLRVQVRRSAGWW